MKHKKERRDQVNRYSMPHDYITYTISASENESNAATGRLCIILGKTAFEFMISKDFFAILTHGSATLGLDNVMFSCYVLTRDKGRTHLEIMEKYQLVVANTIF